MDQSAYASVRLDGKDRHVRLFRRLKEKKLVFGEEFAYVARSHARHRDALQKERRAERREQREARRKAEERSVFDDDDRKDYGGGFDCGGDDDGHSFGRPDVGDGNDDGNDGSLHRSNVDFDAIDGVFGGGRSFDDHGEVMEYVFQHCTDLEQLFGSHVNIENELRHRFDGLPIHRICSFQLYHPTEAVVAQLEDAIVAGYPSPDPTSLHILCCSGTQRLELYRIVDGTYPRLLVAEDKWGAPPILYAFWGGAPGEVVWYLVDQHKPLFPDGILDALAEPYDLVVGIVYLKFHEAPNI